MMKSVNPRGFMFLLALLYLVSGAVFIFFLMDGWNFYTAPLLQRPLHTRYLMLKPGGIVSHGLGVLGSAMILTMQLYSARKRFDSWRNWGSLPRWLDLHIFLGISGPLFIILHSTFKVQGLVAVSFYSMMAVVLSGILGRYIYLQIPRNIQGHELTIQELETLHADLTSRLEAFRQQELLAQWMQKLAVVSSFSHKSFPALLVGLIRDDLKLWRSMRKLKRELRHTPTFSPELIGLMTRLAAQKARTQRRILLLDHMQRIFHYWHVIHKPFAIVMFIVMFIHIGVALWLGYSWIL